MGVMDFQRALSRRFNIFDFLPSEEELQIAADYRQRYPSNPIGERRGGNVLTTVSEADLNASGIKGIKYKAGQLSGVKDTDATNYVIFDENLINILAKYGIVGGVGIGAMKSAQDNNQQPQGLLY